MTACSEFQKMFTICRRKSSFCFSSYTVYRIGRRTILNGEKEINDSHCSGHKIILECTITDCNTVLQQYAWGRYRGPYFKEDVPNNSRVYAFGKTLGRKYISSLCKASRYTWSEFCSFEGKWRLLRSRTEEQSVGIVGIYLLAIRTCRSIKIEVQLNTTVADWKQCLHWKCSCCEHSWPVIFTFYLLKTTLWQYTEPWLNASPDVKLYLSESVVFLLNEKWGGGWAVVHFFPASGNWKNAPMVKILSFFLSKVHRDRFSQRFLFVVWGCGCGFFAGVGKTS